MENIDSFDTQKTPKKYVEYNCENCDFNTCNKKDYNRHLTTVKHKKILDKLNDNKIPENVPKIYKCINCEKVYKHAPTLSRHKKTCSIETKKEEKEKIEYTFIDFMNNFQKIETEDEIYFLMKIKKNK